MSGAMCVPREFIDRVEAMRRAQVEYFAMITGRRVGMSAGDKAQALRECKKLESEIDEWIALYRAEVARWQGWVAAKKYQAEQADLLSLDQSEPMPDTGLS